MILICRVFSREPVPTSLENALWRYPVKHVAEGLTRRGTLVGVKKTPTQNIGASLLILSEARLQAVQS